MLRGIYFCAKVFVRYEQKDTLEQMEMGTDNSSRLE